jgi:hypothetical protein
VHREAHCPPPVDRRPDPPLGDCAERGDDGRLSLAEDQGDVPSLARSQRGASAGSAPVGGDSEGQVAAQDENGVAMLIVDAQDAPVVEARGRTGIIRPGVAHELNLHLTHQTLDGAQELILRPQLVPPVRLGAHGHQISEPHRTGGRPKRRFEDVGVGDVPPLGGERANRPHREAAALCPVQEGAEERRAVEPRPAEPVERAVAADQRRRATVTDDRVIADGWVSEAVVGHARTARRSRSGSGQRSDGDALPDRLHNRLPALILNSAIPA